MKKALVVFILLAFAGSGLFAQTFTWNGFIDGGIAAMNLGAEEEWTFGVVSPHQAGNGSRARLNWAFTNAQANAGFFVRVQAQGASGNFAENPMELHRAYGWVKLFNDMVELRGGRIWDDFMWADEPFGWGYSTWGTAFGINAHVRPTDMITIALGARSANRLGDFADFESGALGLWGGIGFDLPGTAIVRASMLHDDTQTNAMAYARITAVADFRFDLVFNVNRLDEFGDLGLMHGMLFAQFSGLPGIGLGLVGQFAQSNVEGDDDLFMNFGGWVDYTINDIQLAVHLGYTSGGTYNYGLSLWSGATFFNGFEFDSDYSFFTVRPNIQIRATNAAVWNTGVVVNMELGDFGAAGGTSDDKLSFGVYSAVRIGF